jgi:hypothetical protein
MVDDTGLLVPEWFGIAIIAEGPVHRFPCFELVAGSAA